MMNFDSGTAYAESDADDEYERSLHAASPVIATDSEISPTDSEGLSSTEHTPTTYGHRSSADRLPETVLSEWTAEEVADFIATIGLEQYSDIFVENEIVGEALVALLHDDLKSMGISSVGHRLTILKSVYDVKKAQDVPIESDHYQPLSADAEAQYATATLKDIKNLVEQLRLRDERMSLMDQDLRRLAEDYRRLEEKMLPYIVKTKNAQQPLPNVSNGDYREDYNGDYTAIIPPPAPTPSIPTSQSMPTRRPSTKKFNTMGTTPKVVSPGLMQVSHERPLNEQALDPQRAALRAVNASQNLTAGNGLATATSPGYSPNIPSPTSPPMTGSGTLGPKTYRSDDRPASTTRSNFPENDYRHEPKQPPRRGQTPAPDTPGSGGSSGGSVEIFKSFRVSMDDPCYKVLPAALKKYNINAPWDQYALYIVYGDQERCLGLEEKPLILFKQLDKEGKKPMFMLRKTTAGGADAEVPGSAGLGSTGPRTVTYDPPGGII